MSESDSIQKFLAGSSFAVVGASTDRSKYGNKVLRCYQQNKRAVTPVHPKEGTIEGLACVPDLASVAPRPHGVSIITPPVVTEKVVQQAIALGIRHLWMQPGAESAAAIDAARAAGIDVIAGGPCVLVVLGYRE
ncbi:MAG: CoA-binding protein [Planctomycetes bacterium]|nr:CoA-binding protein [Planctomycetota bacterium]